MSSQRAALIAGIRSAPDDDAPRLVCADWFEEQGDEANVARAEFIRVQIERARLPVEDVRHSELQARELRLLKRYAPLWCGSHFVFRKVRFRRGFVEGVHLHLQHFLHHRRQMLALEPVRDVRLTGWYRATADLFRRVAACPELQEIETLRIHHQGPHKGPPRDLVTLLESPHWRRLRVLHGTQVVFDADARRRFERLPVLRQVTELVLPTLDRYPHEPGEWLSDGGGAFAEQWGELRSLTLPDYLSIDLLRRLTAMPWWNRLTTIVMTLPFHNESAALSLLGDRLPEGLRELHLAVSVSPTDLSRLEPFLEQLARVPLRSLRLHWTPLGAEVLANLLAGTNRWQLRELILSGCDISEEHVRVLADAPGAAHLLFLDLLGNMGLTAAAARALFSSQSLCSLVHLAVEMDGAQRGPEGTLAPANVPAWNRVRSLDISATGLRQEALEALLASPNLRYLNWLNIRGGGTRNDPVLRMSPPLARAIIGLPHLAHLQLVGHIDAQGQRILANSSSLAWQQLSSYDEWDVQTWRALGSPERTPPLDAALEGDGRGR
jgi:uncharacterized protein (TIGR02996 family)